MVGALLGLAGFLAIGVVAGFAYLIMMGTVLGRRGIENVGAIVTLPMFALFAGVLWIAVDGLVSRRSGPIAPARALLYGAALGLLLSLLIAGPRGFTLAGGSTLVSYFLIVVAAGGAGLHRLLAVRARR